MTRDLVVLATAMLIGCSGDEGSKDAYGTTDTVGDDDDDGCATVVSTFPVSGDNDVFFKSDVRFTLSETDPTASVEVKDGTGAVVAGNTEVVDKLVTWLGDDFAPTTAYTATLTYACAGSEIQFTTSDVGPPITVDLTGRVYALDLGAGDWVKPAGVGPLIATQLGDTQVLVSPTSVGTDTIEMIGAVGASGVQDACTPTLPFPPAEWEDPFFSLSADLLPLALDDLDINIEDLDLSGGFATDGSRIQGAALRGIVDTRQLAAAFPDVGSTEGGVCELLSTFGVTCEECTSDGTPYCMSVYVDAIDAGYLAASTITPRTPEDISADPSCP